VVVPLAIGTVPFAVQPALSSGPVSSDGIGRVREDKVTGEGDSSLAQRVSEELGAYNAVAAEARQQREFTGKASGRPGRALAGLTAGPMLASRPAA